MLTERDKEKVRSFIREHKQQVKDACLEHRVVSLLADACAIPRCEVEPMGKCLEKILDSLEPKQYTMLGTMDAALGYIALERT